MKKYTLTEIEHAELVEACKPVPYMIIGGVAPVSPAEKAMFVWKRVANRVGCDVNTIAPAGDDTREFLGEPV